MACAVLAISWAAILVRLAQAPPLVTGAHRLGMASLLFWGAAAIARVSPLSGWTPRRLAEGAVAAAFLALHFGLWIASLGLTTVASSVLLVATQPVFVAVLGYAVLGERVPRSAAAGIAVALAGSATIAGGDVRLAGGAWRGDLLALGGAAAVAAHYLLVRRLRAAVDLLPLVCVVNPLAALLLFGAAAVAGEPLAGFASASYGAFFLLALGPTVVGHTLLNWALRYRKAYEVNVATLGEPLGATLLALLLFGERLSPHVFLGGLLVLAGILLAWGVPPRARGTRAPRARA
ncbi:MAG: DMT family transporter [Gemmatimonadota bacterium]